VATNNGRSGRLDTTVQDEGVEVCDSDADMASDAVKRDPPFGDEASDEADRCVEVLGRLGDLQVSGCHPRLPGVTGVLAVEVGWSDSARRAVTRLSLRFVLVRTGAVTE
jgi:hypothetical protein